MRAFISHSIHESDHHLITMLSNALKEKGMNLSTGVSPYHEHNRLVNSKIIRSDIFIGFASVMDHNFNDLIREARVAMTHNIPVFILVEEKFAKNHAVASYFRGAEIVPYDKENPESTIENLKNIQDESWERFTKKKSASNTDTIIVIMAVAAIALVFSILASNRKK